MNLFGRLALIQDCSYGSPIYLMLFAEFAEGLLVEYVFAPELFLECCLLSALRTKFLPTSITGIRLNASELTSLSGIKKPTLWAVLSVFLIMVIKKYQF